MDTRHCTSKYHIGERDIPLSNFRTSNSGKLSNRCIDCEHATTSAYQKSEHGKLVKAQHYSANVEKYKQIEKRTKQTQITLDKGSSYLYKTAKRRANRYNLEFNISLQDVIVPELCPVLNIPLYFGDSRTDNTPSIDRIDNTKGYVIGNVKVISWRANRLKQDLTIEDINKLQQYIQSNIGE